MVDMGGSWDCGEGWPGNLCCFSTDNDHDTNHIYSIGSSRLGWW